MPKLKYDVSGVDPEARDFKTPAPGVYRTKVLKMDVIPTRNGDNMLKVEFDITKGDFKGSHLWENIVLTEASEWKLDQFLQAVKLTDGRKRKGILDTDNPAKLPELLCRVKNETYEEQVQAKVVAMLPFNATELTDEVDEDDDDDEEAPDYGAMSLAQLRKAAKANDIDTAGKSKQQLVDDLSDPAGPLDDEDEELDDEPDDEPEPEDDDVDLTTMPIGELRALAKGYEVYAKGMTRAALIAAIEDDEPEDDEPESDAVDYSEWSLDDLKEEAESRGLNPKQPKSKLVAALTAGDTEDPFEED